MRVFSDIQTRGGRTPVYAAPTAEPRKCGRSSTPRPFSREMRRHRIDVVGCAHQGELPASSDPLGGKIVWSTASDANFPPLPCPRGAPAIHSSKIDVTPSDSARLRCSAPLCRSAPLCVSAARPRRAAFAVPAAL